MNVCSFQTIYIVLWDGLNGEIMWPYQRFGSTQFSIYLDQNGSSVFRVITRCCYCYSFIFIFILRTIDYGSYLGRAHFDCCMCMQYFVPIYSHQSIYIIFMYWIEYTYHFPSFDSTFVPTVICGDWESLRWLFFPFSFLRLVVAAGSTHCLCRRKIPVLVNCSSCRREQK